MPAVQLDMAKVLVAGHGKYAGMRISYAQLVAAASSMTAGVEVWVQAQQQLGVDSDIPSVAEDICSSSSTSHPHYAWVSCNWHHAYPSAPANKDHLFQRCKLLRLCAVDQQLAMLLPEHCS
jgi:hypothetical protein